MDGIRPEDRGSYDYAPPAVFFNGGTPAAGLGVYNVVDYGAKADAAVDNRAAIQAAIDAAHEAGGGLVYVPSGTYGIAGHPKELGALYLKDNVFLMGAGMGETVLRVLDHTDDPITGIVRTAREQTVNYGLADITLDGNRDNNAPDLKVDGYYSGGIPAEQLPPGTFIADYDAWVLRVEARNNNGYGFDPHERTYRLTIADSVAHHNHKDGFVADYIVDGVYRNNLAYENDRHGFNITTTTNDFLLADNIARDNGLGATGGAGITLQRGSFDIGFPHNIKIVGGEVSGNRKEGILIRMSDNVLVTGVDIHDNGSYGIRLKGASNVSVIGNRIVGSSTSAFDKYSSIGIGAEFDSPAISGKTFTSDYNLFRDNIIAASDLGLPRYGFEEKPGEADFNRFADNTITGQQRGEAKLFGAHSSWVTVGTSGNDLLIAQQISTEIYGYSGNDKLFGGPGNDLLVGGDGADKLSGGDGSDTISYAWSGAAVQVDMVHRVGHGGQAEGDEMAYIEAVVGSRFGDDLIGSKNGDDLDGLAGADTLTGNGGDDMLRGGDGEDVLSGNDGHDRLWGEGGDDALWGGMMADTLWGGWGNDSLHGGDGWDVLSGNQGHDRLSGQGGNDALWGGTMADTLWGGWGNDSLHGGDGWDVLSGNQGHDRLWGEGGNDALWGGSMADTLWGGWGNDSLHGGDGWDVLSGNQGDDRLWGESGGDKLWGGAGNDTLDGGGGPDWLVGGRGADSFVFEPGGGADTIADFSPGQDGLDFSAFNLGAISDLMALAHQDGPDVVIDFGDGDILVLRHLHAGDLGTGNILL